MMRTEKMGRNISKALITGTERAAKKAMDSRVWKLEKVMRLPSVTDGTCPGQLNSPANSTSGI